jgi:signal peptidase II
VTVTTPQDDALLDDVDIVEDDEAVEADGADGAVTAPASTWRGPSVRRWILFAALAAAVVVVDQLAKLWIVGTIKPGAGVIVIPDLLNFVHGQNSGILFGMLPRSGLAFAFVSFGVTALIVFYHAKAGRGFVTTVALGLLLGGAIGNMIDRLTQGYVVDWIDMGVGVWRFWTYNVADAGITTAILLLILMAAVPRVAEWRADA